MSEPRYAPEKPVDMALVQRAAFQGQFLREHADLISPWMFPLAPRMQREMGRLVRTWGQLSLSLENEKKRVQE